ncbi:MAG: penicillin-insensitive murein endopeptidase [Candidatus Dadabacteria bacterium]|nr:penicillin-insensitive murein endopeptidase [Candidatus Dadabacteria bacterium]
MFNSNLFSYDRYSISESIGDYHAGCVKKSIELPNGGSGYQIIRPSRKRYYGNQITIDYIRKLSRKFNKKYKSNILIADISKKGGGPIPYEHSSHQTGLDADILLFHKENYIELYTREEREELEPNSVLDETKKKIDFSKWEELNGELLKTAANYSEVNRIFINPAIKKHLCNRYENESWLKKLRPWWGHDGHFHVRLKCPDNNHKCVDQKNPGHIECGEELDFWLSDEAFAKRKRERAKPRRKKALRLPPECR